MMHILGKEMKNIFGLLLIIIMVSISPSTQAKELTFTRKEAYDIGSALYFDESNDENIIEKDLGTCLNEHEGWQCWSAASENYEKILQTLYNGIVNNTSNTPEKQNQFVQSLVDSQDKWVQFRKAEMKANQTYTLADDMGTIMNVVMAKKEMRLIKERIIELMVFYGIGQS